MWNSRKKQSRCSCRRTRKGQPKLVCSLCHGGGGYHPSVRLRIRGKEVCRVYLVAPDRLDIEK